MGWILYENTSKTFLQKHNFEMRRSKPQYIVQNSNDAYVILM